MTRPIVTVRKPMRGDTVQETVVEFVFEDGSGGILSFSRNGDVNLIEAYRCDDFVKFRIPEGNVFRPVPDEEETEE